MTCRTVSKCHNHYFNFLSFNFPNQASLRSQQAVSTPQYIYFNIHTVNNVFNIFLKIFYEQFLPLSTQLIFWKVNIIFRSNKLFPVEQFHQDWIISKLSTLFQTKFFPNGKKISCVIGYSRNKLSLGSKFSQKIVLSELEKIFKD